MLHNSYLFLAQLSFWTACHSQLPNGTHQLLVCTDDLNIMAGSVQTIMENQKLLFGW